MQRYFLVGINTCKSGVQGGSGSGRWQKGVSNIPPRWKCEGGGGE